MQNSMYLPYFSGGNPRTGETYPQAGATSTKEGEAAVALATKPEGWDFGARILYAPSWHAVSGKGQGLTFQMSAAYSEMVRSLENFPELATFKIAVRAHSFDWDPPCPKCGQRCAAGSKS